MTSPGLTTLQRKLEDLSRRLDARSREFSQKGEFSDIHHTLMEQIGKRHKKLRMKVASAARDGTRWDLVKAEFARDFSSIFDTFLQLEARLDAGAMKKKR